MKKTGHSEVVSVYKGDGPAGKMKIQACVIQALLEWKQLNGERFIETFKTGISDANENVLKIDNHRHRVFRFFVRLRRLSEGGFLEKGILRIGLYPQAVQEVFLDLVDKLGEAVCEVRTRVTLYCATCAIKTGEVRWIQYQGPGTVTFSTPSVVGEYDKPVEATTQARFDTPRSYVLPAIAFDRLFEAWHDVSVTVT